MENNVTFLNTTSPVVENEVNILPVLMFFFGCTLLLTIVLVFLNFNQKACKQGFCCIFFYYLWIKIYRCCFCNTKCCKKCSKFIEKKGVEMKETMLEEIT